MADKVQHSASVDHRKRLLFAVLLVGMTSVALIILGQSLIFGWFEDQSHTSSAPTQSPQPTHGRLHHLQDPDPVIRLKTVRQLASLNPGNQYIMKHISNTLVTDSNREVQLAAAESLASLPPVEGLHDDLVMALNDDDAEVKRLVIQVIVAYGGSSEGARQALEAMATNEDEDASVRLEANSAVKRLARQ